MKRQMKSSCELPNSIWDAIRCFWITKSYSFNQFECNSAIWHILHWHDLSSLGHYKPWLFFIRFVCLSFILFIIICTRLTSPIFEKMRSEIPSIKYLEHRILLSNKLVPKIEEGDEPTKAIFGCHSFGLAWSKRGQ